MVARPREKNTFMQNRMFQNNQRQFHRELNQEEKYVKMRNLMPKNRKSLGGTFGISQMSIRKILDS